MGFGLNVNVAPPKVDIPKVDVASAVGNVTNAVSGAVESAKNAANNTVNTATSAVDNAVNTAVSIATSTVASLTTVAGAIADVAVSFTGMIEDIVLEPHLSLSANAGYGNTNFEKGPILVRIEMTPDEVKGRADLLRLHSSTFNVEKKLAEFTEQDGETVGIVFEDAPMNESYTLEMIFDDGGTITLFENVTYGDLKRTKQSYTG